MGGHFENVADGKQELINRVLMISVAAALLQVRQQVQQGKKIKDYQAAFNAVPCIPSSP